MTFPDPSEKSIEGVRTPQTSADRTIAGVQQSDPCRLAQLRSHTSKPGHLYRKFTWGNRKSLIEQPGDAGIAVRERLVEYYK